MRKPKKLPAECARMTYDLEYGTDTLEMHRDAVSAGKRVLIVDDLLATGGTAAAAARMVRELGGEVGGHGVRGGTDVLEWKTQAGWARCVLADSVRQMSDIRRATVPALAKINLDLRVIGKREDGYHELRTIFQTISLADSIELSFAPPRGVHPSCWTIHWRFRITSWSAPRASPSKRCARQDASRSG